MSASGSTARANERAMQALGIRSIVWLRNRSTEADWAVLLESGEVITITTHWLGTERSVLLEVALILAERNHPVRYVSAVQS